MTNQHDRWIAERVTNRVHVVSQGSNADLLRINGRAASPMAAIVGMGNGQLRAQLVPQVLPDETIAGQTVA